MKHSRRDFLKAGATSLVCASALLESSKLYAKALHLPLGLQLYSVRELLPKDYAGTLKEIGALGYREVESAGYYNHTAAEVKQAVSDANLKLVSAHYSSDDLHKDLDRILAFHHELGVSYIICSFPEFKDPERVRNMKTDERLHAFTLDDWRWNAERFNALGEKVAAAGMKFGYHNHTMEFRKLGDAVPYVELLRLTDPSKVIFELDCGWVIVGGGDPVEYLRNYPKRIVMLHVKDFKLDATSAAQSPDDPKVEELGLGTVKLLPIFEAAAKTGNIQHCFVEQEAFNVPPVQSLKMDADYMHKIGAA